jgi:hypothetical protein
MNLITQMFIQDLLLHINQMQQVGNAEFEYKFNDIKVTIKMEKADA